MLQELCIRPNIDMFAFQDYQYASQIGNIDTLLGAKQDRVKIALLTSGEDLSAYDGFRKVLYGMSANFSPEEFIDLGNIKGAGVGITEVVDYLSQKGILSIIVSQDSLLPHALLRSFSNSHSALHLSVFDSRLDFSWGKEQKYLADYLFPHYPATLSQLNWLGYQSYFVDPAVLSVMGEHHFETQRVGNLRSNLEEVEPIMRDSDIIAFNISAIGFMDAPDTVFPNPNGFSANEVCQIMRYAGVSDRPAVIGLYGYQPQPGNNNVVTALLLAQMIWYSIEGYYQRKHEFPPQLDQLTRYEVQLPVGQLPVAFFKSTKSERWWFYIGDLSIKSSDLAPELLVSCSYDDYLKACEGDLPNRLFNALNRFD